MKLTNPFTRRAPAEFSIRGKKAITAGTLTLLSTLAYLFVDEELSSVRGGLFASQRNAKSGRGLSIYLGDGDCELKNPIAKVPEDVDLWKTLLVGFPSGDKRMAYLQMEALTGLPSKDDWDFVYNGYSNAPFIKTNYPHNSGTWSWGEEADQVALVVQYIRRSLVEFSDIWWYMSFESDYNKDRVKVEEMYGTRNDVEEFYKWRDSQVLIETYKYGWYIDYWMENGLFRDPFTHNEIDADYWDLWNNPKPIKNDRDKVTICHRTMSKKNPMVEIEVSASAVQAHIDHGDWIGSCEDAAQDPTFKDSDVSLIHTDHPVTDSHCSSVTESCRPVMIISADKLRSSTEGPAETEIIGNILMTNEKMAKWVITKAAWGCIWDRMIAKNEGPVSFDDRDINQDPNCSAFMLEEMLGEVTRLVEKYRVDPWEKDIDAQRLVSLLSEHQASLKTEIDLVKSGKRTLSEKDIFGPHERKALSYEKTEQTQVER